VQGWEHGGYCLAPGLSLPWSSVKSNWPPLPGQPWSCWFEPARADAITASFICPATYLRSGWGHSREEESDSVFPKNTLLHPPILQDAAEGEGKNWLVVSPDSWILPFSL